MGHVARMERKRLTIQAMDWSPEGRVEEADCERTDRNYRAYVRTSDAWI